MAFTIPSSTFNNYFEAVDELINNEFIGQDITLFFKEKVTTTVTDHHLQLVNGPNTNYGADGQLTPFKGQGGGTSFSEVESTTTIRVRWYPDPKQWSKIATVNIPEVSVLIIGYMSDIEKLQRTNQIGCEVAGQIQRYVLATQLHVWGFGNRYFFGQLKEA